MKLEKGNVWVEMNQEELSRLRIIKFAKVLLIVVVALILGVAIFTFFRIRVNAKRALREAKDIRMALRSADIEMYAESKSIYNPERKNGIEDTVEEKVNSLVEVDGQYRITSYSKKNHELTGMTYRKGDYFVTFKKSGDNLEWKVDYLFNVYIFYEDDVAVD